MGAMDVLGDAMMKKFGIDPEKIKSQIENAGEDFKRVVTHFDARINSLEQKLDYLIACQKQNDMVNQPNAISLQKTDETHVNGTRPAG